MDLLIEHTIFAFTTTPKTDASSVSSVLEFKRKKMDRQDYCL